MMSMLLKVRGPGMMGDYGDQRAWRTKRAVPWRVPHRHTERLKQVGRKSLDQWMLARGPVPWADGCSVYAGKDAKKRSMPWAFRVNCCSHSSAPRVWRSPPTPSHTWYISSYVSTERSRDHELSRGIHSGRDITVHWTAYPSGSLNMFKC